MKKALSLPISGRYQMLFDDVMSARLGRDPDDMYEQRQAAFDRFLQVGLPTRRSQDWK